MGNPGLANRGFWVPKGFPREMEIPGNSFLSELFFCLDKRKPIQIPLGSKRRTLSPFPFDPRSKIKEKGFLWGKNAVQFHRSLLVRVQK